jgi:hypothetical protein
MRLLYFVLDPFSLFDMMVLSNKLISFLFLILYFFLIHIIEQNITENYEYNRSMYPQSENEYSPCTDKQYNSYINDINSGV